MTAFAAIQKALKQFGYPVVPDKYDGKEKRYIVYNYALLQGADFGDDAPGANLASVQVHLYLPVWQDDRRSGKNNYRADLDKIRNALFGWGFTYPEVTVLRHDETETYHIVFECEYEEEQEDD